MLTGEQWPIPHGNCGVRDGKRFRRQYSAARRTWGCVLAIIAVYFLAPTHLLFASAKTVSLQAKGRKIGTIQIHFDQRTWRLAEEGLDNSGMSATQLFIPEQQTSGIGGTMSVQAALLTAVASPKEKLGAVLEGTIASLQQKFPDVQWQIIERSDADLLYEWQAQGVQGG